MLGELENNKIDVVFGLGPFIADENRFEYLEQALQEFVTLIVPTADEFPAWMNLWKGFQAEVWISLILVTFFYGILWWTFGRKNEIILSFRKFLICVQNSFYILIQGNIIPPKRLPLRFFFLFWCLFIFIVYTEHQSQL